MRHMVMLLATAALAAGCAPGVPDEPTWTEDVRPIVIANCVRCHSTPSLGAAPTSVRLDKYDGEDRDGDGDIDMDGASAVSNLMAEYVEGEEMPPGFPLWQRQKDIVNDWYENGSPRGEPLEGNEAPTMELGDFEGDGDTLVADYSIDDPDDDYVTGRLVADPDPDVDGDEVRITFDLFSGRSQIAWNVSGVIPGFYELSAVIDDGSGEETLAVGSVEVAP